MHMHPFKLPCLFMPLLFSLAFVACEKRADTRPQQSAKLNASAARNFGTLHNAVLLKAVKYIDSARLAKELKGRLSTISPGSSTTISDATFPDPMLLSHDLTMKTIFNTDAMVFNLASEIKIAEQAHLLTHEAITSRLIAQPNEVVKQLLVSPAFNALSVREQDYFRRLTDIFRTNDYNLMSQKINTEINNFNNELWALDEGSFIEGFLSITQASTEFWKNIQFYDPASPPLVPHEPYVQVDAAGYLYGWFKSWAIDEEPLARVRIKNGLLTAAEWSTVKVFSRPHLGYYHNGVWINPFDVMQPIDPNAQF
jgi:hypothetical protein